MAGTAPPSGAQDLAAATVSGPLTGGQGPFIGEGSPPDLAAAGYVQHEYVASGTATSYATVGATGRDGRWKVVPTGTAPYRTRILVRAPARAADFRGTVLVEWNNVSGGVDADPEFTSTEADLLRRGDAWVGVSAQYIGVEGGPVLVAAPGTDAVVGKGLVNLDPARYGTLSHPGDAYSYDIYTQVARALRDGKGLGGLRPRIVLAGGESQSALALTTYYDAFQPVTHAFDGFLVHSRASESLPVAVAGRYADLAHSIGVTPPVLFRTDVRAPVLDVQAESDVTGVLDSGVVRQPDSSTFRLWEVAGTSHADRYLLSPQIASQVDCGVPINDGPMHLVVGAALADLVRWVRAGTTPPHAARLATTGTGSTLAVQRNAEGIALGGIRTPPVDVPTEVLSGVPGPSQSLLCLLLGSTKPLTTAQLAAMYPSRAVYAQRYGAAVARTIAAGFVLPASRAALMAYAQPALVPVG